MVICGLAGHEVTGKMRGKIFASACHADLVLVYGSEGALVLLVVKEEPSVLGSGYLPDMKQMWFTFACMLDDLWMLRDNTIFLFIF